MLISAFIFIIVITYAVFRLKYGYDAYVRRQVSSVTWVLSYYLCYKFAHILTRNIILCSQRQYIEMEQMASRPFFTVLLELIKSSPRKSSLQTNYIPPEPTPISFEPCFGSNVGVLSVFVQLPGRPNLAIGSALVSLDDDTSSFDEFVHDKDIEKPNTSAKRV